VGVETLIRRIESFRETLAKFVETRIFKPIAEMQGFTDEKKSKDAKKEAKKAETESTSSVGKTKKETEALEPCGLKSVDDLYNDVDVRFILYFTEDGYDALKDNIEKFEKQFKLTTSWKTTNMVCFDTDFNIVKYKTIGDILEDFVVKRLPLYESRRQSILATLLKQIQELDAKRRFIQAILDEILILQKRTDVEIVENLKTCNIPPLSCPSKPDEYDSYDYVLKLRIDRVKQSAIVELDEQILEKQEEIRKLEEATATSLWLDDLQEFEEAWLKYSKERMAEYDSVIKAEPKKKGKVMRAKKPVVCLED
jgi:DNA topoisomerase-2